MDPLHSFRLDDRVVIVTGASSGLGAGFARAVVGVGGMAVLAARRADRLDALSAELTSAGATVLTRVTNVADPDDCRALVEAAMARFGRVDALVNNAGVGSTVPSSRETPAGFRAVVDVNLNGTFWMAQACAAVMRPGSAIVNVASIYGLVAPLFPQAAYAASKAGVIGLTRDLAQEWSRRKGIRVNALCPGFFLTEMTEESAEGLREVVATHTMLGRFGEQSDIDPALLFLISDASAFVTGTTLAVDGGWTSL